MIKQKNWILFIVLIFFILFVPNYSNASVSVGKVKNVTVSESTTNSITLTWKKVSKATAYRVYIYNTSTKKYEYYGGTKTNSITIEDLKSSKEYKIKVRAYRTVNGTKYFGSYSNIITTATKPSKVKNVTSKSQTTNTITLTWNKVTRATGYRVYIYNTSTKKYEYYGQTTSNSMTVKNLSASKEYKFKVRAYKTSNGTKYFGSYSSILTTATKPSKTKGLSFTSDGTSSVTVSWNKVTRATGYRIYVYNSSTGKYEYYGQTTSTSIEVKNLTSSKIYKVKVRAYKTSNGTKYYGSYSDVLEVVTKPSKVKNVSRSSSSTSSITLTWDKVSRATGYRVYMYNSSSKSYEYYGQTTSNSITVEGLNSAKTYKFKVRAYKTLNSTKYYGSYSDVVSFATTPSKVSNLTSSSQTTNTITLTWNKVTRATGYRVYVYSQYSGSYEYYGQTTSTSLKISDLDTAKFYKIKVRAYYTLDGTKYYGSYSSILTQKTKSTSSIRAGIDVSYYQGDINWTKVKKTGVEFVMIRIGYRGSSSGGIYEDKCFEDNINGAISAGLEVGVYFFSYAKNTTEAEEEAKFVISTLKSYGYDEDDVKYIAYDFEVFGKNRVSSVSTSQVNKNTIAFLKYVSKKDFTPILYGNKSQLTNKFDVDSIQESVSDCLIWLAQYNDKTSYSGTYNMWQYSSTGTISGISGNVDLNVVYFKES